MLSEHTFFVIERITDILKHEEKKEGEFSDNVERAIFELRKELSRIYDYLRDVDSKYDNSQELSDHEQQFYLNLSSIVHSSDDILDLFMSKDDAVADHIKTLLEKIHHSYNTYNTYSTLFQIKLVGGTNMPGYQIIGNSSKAKKVVRPKSYGHYPNCDLVGLTHEIKTLLNHLLQPDDETCIVGIVGMGGSGKTTLVKHIYHHPQINENFTSKVWICISESWNKTSILNQIWRQASQDPMAAEKGYDLIVSSLYTFLSSRSYLIILDDIWSLDAWFDISPALPMKGRSKVVVTTRNKVLPKYINQNVVIVEPRLLDYKESYELFKMRACLPNESIPLELEPLGVDMVKRCEGLPLAIKALAGILMIDKRRINWDRIRLRLMDTILNIGNESTQGVVKDILALSYYELPHHLKQCVLYLHVFPENYEIKAQKLIQMWIAECFVDEESVAKEYLEEMDQRCIVRDVKRNDKGQVRQFRTHGLIRQMVVDINKERGLVKNPLRLVPRTTFYGDEQKSYDSHMEVLPRYNSYVRSLIMLDLEDHCNFKLQPFIKLRLLRVLILNQIPLKQLPEGIGTLIHLRYLKLSGNSYHFPESIGNLENLLTIDIRNLYTSEVQINLEKLQKLEHLYMPMRTFHDAIETKMEVLKLEKLKKLKTLWGAKGGNWLLSGMLNLSATVQELCLLDIRTEEQLMAVFRTQCITLYNLDTLVLMWCHNGVELCDMSILSKCRSLTKLKLGGRIAASTTIMFPPNLIKLEMAYTHIEEKQVMNIINKSCPCLKTLVLGDRAYVGSELVCDANSFLQLKKLKLDVLSNLKRWKIEKTAMPTLRHLTIKGSENMDLNPDGWACISNNQQLKYMDLSPKFKEKLGAYIRKGTYITEDTDFGRSVSIFFHYDVARITILAISCILYQLYLWLTL